MDEKDFDIVIGETHYRDDVSRFMNVVMRQVEKTLKDRSRSPSSIEEAFLLREAKFYPYYREYCEMLLEAGVGKFNEYKEWQGETPEEIEQRLLAWLRQDEHTMGEIDAKKEAITKATGMIDMMDEENVQMVLIRDWSVSEVRRPEAYMYLVVYPPEQIDGGVVRRREVSFPTAMCHAMAAVALLDESFVARVLDKSQFSGETFSPQRIKGGDRNYTMRLLKTRVIPDEELEEIVTTHGRTLIDRFTQAGIAVLDRVRKTKGQHIDPFSALRDQRYALSYALACHKGIGSVANERLNLPPVVVDKL